jgi:predicted transcriptional regulator
MTAPLKNFDIERLVSLLALAETARSTQEYLIHTAAAAKLQREHPELAAIDAGDLRMQRRIAEYREGGL